MRGWLVGFSVFSILCAPTQADELKVVSWNIGATPYEILEQRSSDFAALDSDLAPDVIVLVELSNRQDLARIANALGWNEYHAVVSDFGKQNDEIHFSLEVGVLSKVPIVSVLELDAGPDGKVVQVFSSAHPNGDGSIPVVEQQLIGASNALGVNATDRGSLRVDLQNGVTIFPVHLKSNSNTVCGGVISARTAFSQMGLSLPTEVQGVWEGGNAKKAKDDMSNAQKRERVIAAVKLRADEAVRDGRIVLIAGDWNTSFETMKFGTSLSSDCTVVPFTCEKGPFPAAACTGEADGFDDTFSILTSSLVSSPEFEILTRGLGRTFTDEAYADKAIDHIAVATTQASDFTDIGKSSDAYGSDHFPIFVTVDVP